MQPFARKFAGLALAFIAFAGVATRPYEGPRLGVVDMSRLVSQHKQSQAEQNLIQQWKDAKEKLLEKMDKELKAEVASLDQFKEGSDELRAKQTELKVAKFKLDQEFASLNDQFELKVGASIAEAHARVAAACKAYLDSHDLDMVLQYASTPVRKGKSGDVIPEIVVRSVVAYRSAIDVTDGVLAILDGGK